MAAVSDLTRDELLAWVAANDEAWRTNDPEAIGRLFSEDGIYRLGPWEGPWRGYTGPIVGREAIVDAWVSTFDPDATFKADVDVVAIEGRRGVVQRKITHQSLAGHPGSRYGCLWVIDLDEEGRCREYQEWYVEEPRLEP
jgi:hypothetical protein